MGWDWDNDDKDDDAVKDEMKKKLMKVKMDVKSSVYDWRGNFVNRIEYGMVIEWMGDDKFE